MSNAHSPFHPADLLLPREDIRPETWACVACDQYTSQPEYWREVEALVGDAPSTLRLMLPECDLKDSQERVPRIHAAMTEYLDQGLLTVAVRNGFILCERTTASGTRLGLVGTVDLEAYDYAAGSMPLVRPTEQTIAERLPARLAIRRGAPVELSHILILIDDPDRTVLEPLQAAKADLRKLYDFDLMQRGGHLTGYAVETEERLSHVENALNALKEKQGEHPMLLAVGDGNHSLATAKAYWNEIRETLSPEEREHHPARFALCEIENLHDNALRFEPIHRLITGVWPEDLYDAWERYCDARGMVLSEEGSGHIFTMVIRKDEYPVVVQRPEGFIPCETIQLFLDEFLQARPDASIDYIHGADALRHLAQNKRSVGFILPEINKKTFFQDVMNLGVLPRKTFSMGEADEKRFYMESKRI
ncbi:MAG: DUF1015 domain-containing protein [Clostridia bacterium]|nr:DUF1015 domain-containing protein [Clostridia bacterium]